MNGFDFYFFLCTTVIRSGDNTGDDDDDNDNNKTNSTNDLKCLVIMLIVLKSCLKSMLNLFNLWCIYQYMYTVLHNALKPSAIFNISAPLWIFILLFHFYNCTAHCCWHTAKLEQQNKTLLDCVVIGKWWMLGRCEAQLLLSPWSWIFFSPWCFIPFVLQQFASDNILLWIKEQSYLYS